MKLRIRWDLVLDVVGVLGFCLITAGIWWIYPPAAVIFAGAAIVFICVLIAKWVF